MATDTDYPLATVIVIALACMMLVQLSGELAKPLFPKTYTKVPCSITINSMAHKMNITLMDSCVIEN